MLTREVQAGDAKEQQQSMCVCGGEAHLCAMQHKPWVALQSGRHCVFVVWKQSDSQHFGERNALLQLAVHAAANLLCHAPASKPPS